MRKKICFISDDPSYLGGVSLYTKNLLEILKSKYPNIEITWIYKGKENKSFNKERVKYVEIKVKEISFLDEIFFNRKVRKFLEKTSFDIINSHALTGYWMKNYKKKKNQKIVHTYHGSTYYFYKNHLRRFGLLKKSLILPILWYSFIIEGPPMNKADKIICVSNKVKQEIESLYGKNKKISVINTGIDIEKFKQINKNKIKKYLNLDKKKIYGIYVGRGGYWTKGLDRTINLSEKIYKLNKNFNLIVIGPEYNKTSNLLGKNFVKYLPLVSRENIPDYYSASDIFFCLSRYEGFPLVSLEALASKCLVVCSKDIKHDLIKDEYTGLIAKDFGKKDAERILKILKNKNIKDKIIKNSLRTINTLSLDKWGGKYLKILLT